MSRSAEALYLNARYSLGVQAAPMSSGAASRIRQRRSSNIN
jgi:hypothetical protein